MSKYRTGTLGFFYSEERWKRLEIDDALFARAQSGQAEAFAQVIEGYEKLIFNIAYRYMGNREDAEDVAQEAIIKIFSHLYTIDPEGGGKGFKAWTAKITVNTAIDELRRRKRKYAAETVPEDAELPANTPTPEEETLQRERMRALQAALQRLPDQMRMIIILRDMQGFTYEEMAQVMGCKMGTVKSRLARARSALRALFF